MNSSHRLMAWAAIVGGLVAVTGWPAKADSDKTCVPPCLYGCTANDTPGSGDGGCHAPAKFNPSGGSCSMVELVSYSYCDSGDDTCTVVNDVACAIVREWIGGDCGQNGNQCQGVPMGNSVTYNRQGCAYKAPTTG